MPIKKSARYETQVRNLFRNFFNYKASHRASSSGHNRPYWKEFQAVRRLTSSTDASRLYTIVEQNKHYPFQGLGNTFPHDKNRFIDSRLAPLTPLGLSKELSLQTARLNFYKDQVCASLKGIVTVNDALRREEWAGAIRNVNIHRSLFGESYILLKKELLATLGHGGLSALSAIYKEKSAGFEKTAYSVVIHSIYDLIDPTFDPVRAARFWLDQTSHDRERDWWSRPIEFELFPFAVNRDRLAAALLRINALSLIDLTFCLWRSSALRSEWPDLSSAFRDLDIDIKSCLAENFSETCVNPISCYQIAAEQELDKELFRYGYIYSEYLNAARWFSEMQSLIFRDQLSDMQFDRRWYFTENLSSLTEGLLLNLGSRSDTFSADEIFASPFGNRIGQIRRHQMLYSVACAELLRSKGALIEGEMLVSLLAQASDLQAYLSTDDLDAVQNLDAVRASSLLQFLVAELWYQKTRDGDKELDRRIHFMDAVSHSTCPSIPLFIESLATLNKEVAIRTARICSRRFIERLFLLVASVKEVLENRLALCVWLSEHEKPTPESYREEQEALLREIENLDARSDLDSTRVHVDEEGLREWFSDKHGASVNRYVQTVLAEGKHVANESFLNYFSNYKENESLIASSSIGSDFILLEIVEDTLKVFASDRAFGLDSYLSRRIRHGSLRGHLITPIDRAIRRFEETSKELSETPTASETEAFLSEWRAFVLKLIDDARQRVIQIRSSEHPEGLIRATWRLTVNVPHLDALAGRVRSRVLETHGKYDFFPDVHALCWDCLEPDLAQLRLFASKDFLHRAVNELASSWHQLPAKSQQATASIANELRATLINRVQDVCGWFSRPVFRRDNYDLRTLVKTTFSVIRDLDDNYLFTEQIRMPKDIPVSRGTFDVIGDVLFVLIGNAARHGLKGGVVSVSASYSPTDPNLIALVVGSEFRPERASDDFERIKLALTSKKRSDFDRAAVEEGFSGLRKTVGLLSRIRYPGTYMKAEGDESFHNLDLTILVPWDIALKRGSS